MVARCWRVTRYIWVESGGVQCFFINVNGLKVDCGSRVFECWQIRCW